MASSDNNRRRNNYRGHRGSSRGGGFNRGRGGRPSEADYGFGSGRNVSNGNGRSNSPFSECRSGHSARGGYLPPHLRRKANQDSNISHNYRNYQTPDDEGYSKVRTISFIQTKQLLESILKEDYEENITAVLMDRKTNFKNFLKNLDRIDVDIIRSTLRVLLKASLNDSMKINFRELLTMVLESPFATRRIDSLISFDLHQHMDWELMGILISFMKMTFEIIPTNAFDVFNNRISNLTLIFDNLRLQTSELRLEIMEDFQDLKILAESSNIYGNKQPKVNNRQPRFTEDDGEPPDDYREMSIFPTSADLLSVQTKDVFLRRNKIRGVYRSVDDYLDVQFRLMREDFIQPLREGLLAYKNNNNQKRFDVRVYRNVLVMNCLPTERMGIIYNLSFDVTKLKRVKWAISKRLLFGSLLCFSDDNFQTLLFATVADRNVINLEKGIITVKFCEGVPKKDVEYTLVESTNMFESYRHVLQKLKDMKENDLCLQNYLVFASETILSPCYLRRNAGLEYKIAGISNNIQPGNADCRWPRPVDLEMDESQFRAFRSALTQEICIIQGPPGTGKTYLGLKICQCLLENVQKQLRNFGPILIVCYTNHALDQFLEGISNFTDRIVRIGNRCKSEKLQTFSLLNWKKKIHSTNIFHQKREIFGKLNGLKQDIIDNQALLKSSHETLFPIERLQRFIEPSDYEYLKRIKLRNWLYGGSAEPEYFSPVKDILNNEIDWIIFEEMMQQIYKVVVDAQVELVNDIDDNVEEDMDNEVNYINNQRRLDIDDEDINALNTQFVSALRKAKFYDNDDNDELNELDMSTNDGFIPFRSKVTKNLFKRRLRLTDKMSQAEASQIESLENLCIEDRWRLYRFWRSIYVESLETKSKMIETHYEELCQQLNEFHFEEDRQVMMTQHIIGMTTTGASRYGKILGQVRCKIIIVEEAAEVLESHIIGSLNPGCEHLILIGDHKQLKPNPAVYDLAKRYNLEISLFERLVNNNLHLETLELQHRMRPEIAEIMKFIYQNLRNDESVQNYPNVPAVGRNLFFFDHSEPEKCNEDILSYSNQFEAEFVMNFCKHLMKNGIQSQQITILTLYAGQMFLLRNLMPKKIFEGIRICVVDNFQGEECDIILLSLVRSNELEKIGFLSIENRICVCLSRAKHGLFVFGNFQILANQNELWKSICQHMKNKGLLGGRLELKCQNHPTKELWVEQPGDFSKYPEGGCEEFCNQRLNCGHACRKACHFLDKYHKEVKCTEKCTKLCPNGHRCNLKCYQACRACQINILKDIPTCGHKQLICCSKTPTQSDCNNKCTRILSQCGHECSRKCKEKCGSCFMQVRRTCIECGHEDNYSCYLGEQITCKRKCRSILDCEHECSGTCGECFNGRLHKTCGSICKAQLICGHVCQSKCSQHCPPCAEKCEEGCFHNRCPKECGDDCVPCFEKCKWKCKHLRCSKLCHEICDRAHCDEFCTKMIDCSRCNIRFKCYGVCGEPCRKVCLKCDPEIKEIFFGTEDDDNARFITLWTCGHSFEVSSMDRYMESVPDDGEIVAKRCPRCKTIINKLSCFRYSNIVRIISANIKEVQKTISKGIGAVDFNRFTNKLQTQNYLLEDMFQFYNVEYYFLSANEYEKNMSNFTIMKCNTSLDLCQTVRKNLHTPFMKFDIILSLEHQYIKSCLAKVIKWTNPNFRKFNQFELDQFNTEVDRIRTMIEINSLYISCRDLPELPGFFLELKQMKDFSSSIGHSFRQKWSQFMKEQKYLPNMAITEQERKEIVNAIGGTKGRWFRCPNQHLYVIGDCGGATQVAKCPECNESIGGTQHTLHSGNTFAPEMDLAEQSAWPGMDNRPVNDIYFNIF